MSQEARNTFTVSELRAWANLLCDQLEAVGVTSFDIDNNLYYEIFFSEAFDLLKTPDIVTGDLIDDVMDLRSESAAASRNDFVSIWHVASHLAPLIRYAAVRYEDHSPVEGEGK